MKGQLKVETPEAYLDALNEPRKSDLTAIDTLIRRTVPKLSPCIYSGMLGYGMETLTYASGRVVHCPRIALASNKQYISLYILACNDDGYLAEQYRDKLPKASIGKSCVRFKQWSDLDAKIVERLIKAASKSRPIA